MAICNINNVSFNVRGLRNCNKRQALLEALKQNNIHVCQLQETYFTPDLVPEIEKCFGEMYNCIHSYGSTHSRGVTVMIKKNSDINVMSQKVDTDGRMVLLNLQINNEPYTLLTIYAPNSEKERNASLKK